MLTILKTLRHGESGTSTRKRRSKVNVEAGKSISLQDYTGERSESDAVTG